MSIFTHKKLILRMNSINIVAQSQAFDEFLIFNVEFNLNVFLQQIPATTFLLSFSVSLCYLFSNDYLI